MKKFIIIFILLNISNAYAEAGDGKCDQAKADLGYTSDMITCAYDAYHKADRRLNKIYNNKIAEAKKSDHEDNVPKDVDNLGNSETSLRESERAWVVFRDKDCVRQTAYEVGGRERQIIYPACLEEMTKERIKELSEVNTH